MNPPNSYQDIVTICLAVTLIVCSLCAGCRLGTYGGQVGKPTVDAPYDMTQSSKLDRIQARFEDEKIQSILTGQFWTLAHCASEKETRKTVAAIGMSEHNTEPFSLKTAIKNAGGVDQYRMRVTTLLKSRNETVRGFAAIWLGVLGDKKSTEDLLTLLRSKDLPVEEEFFEGADRARAAMGLGLLGAKEHAGELAGMLHSTNEDIRGGAAAGLAYMKANQYAPHIAKLLADHDDNVQINAVWALAEMDAREHAADIAALLSNDVLGDPAIKESALYALAKMKATDQANAIAPLLQDRFKKGAAVKALALMNAHDYASAIAAILKDKEPLNRCAALLALGIMQDKDYEDQVAAHLEDPEEFVRPYAAWAIIMMESQKHAPKALKLAEASKGVLSVEGQGATQIAIKEFRQVFDRAEESFNRMKQAR